MTIHHATRGKAEKNGVLMTEIDVDGATMVEALWAEQNQRYTASDAKEALEAVLLQRTLRLEYPAITLEQTDNGYSVVTRDPDGPITIYEGEVVPSLATLLDACVEEGIDPEEGYEEPPHGDIVKSRYKIEYAARGNRNGCGDWLHILLENATVGGEGFRIDEFDEILKANAVPFTGKWAELPTSGQRGWQGRYRMNGRQKLERIIVEVGYIMMPNGQKIAADPDWLAEKMK